MPYFTWHLFPLQNERPGSHSRRSGTAWRHPGPIGAADTRGGSRFSKVETSTACITWTQHRAARNGHSLRFEHQTDCGWGVWKVQVSLEWFVSFCGCCYSHQSENTGCEHHVRHLLACAYSLPVMQWQRQILPKTSTGIFIRLTRSASSWGEQDTNDDSNQTISSVLTNLLPHMFNWRMNNGLFKKSSRLCVFLLP